jgi:cellulose synthase/poly-beta-1,6-N-acetylglucosamine synthase-like glycosyltransferase
MVLLVIAAVAFGLLAAAWIVYPAVMWARTRGARSGEPPPSTPTQRVAVVVATRDEPSAAESRVANLRASDYPRDLLDVVVSVDANSAFPLEAYDSAIEGAKVVRGDVPGGKAATLNAGVRTARAGSADIVVFADVGQEFNREAIRRMVDSLRHDRAGGVTGRYTQQRNDSVMAAYASLEAVIRAGQAAGHSVVSTSGSIYAIRAELWHDLPAGLICDDLYTTLSIVRQGMRVGFCPDAVAFDPRTFTRDQQFVRRVRTLTGLIQYCTIEPGALLPWRNVIWSHFVLHKVLRLLTPIPLAIGGLSLFLWATLRAPVVVAAVLAFALVALIAARFLAPASIRRFAGDLAWLLRLQMIPAIAIANGLRRRWTVWTPTPQRSHDHRAGAGAGA